MHDWIHSLKPAAPTRGHLLLAAVMWTVVGAVLLFFGVRWTLVDRMPHEYLLVVAAIGAGLLKSRLVLDRVARRAVDRIRRRGDGRCIGGFLSLRSWTLLLIMMLLGHLLRHGLVPHLVVGLLYIPVGTSLLISTRLFWGAYGRHRH